MRGVHPQKALRLRLAFVLLELHFLHVVRNVIQPQQPLPHGYATTCAATRSWSDNSFWHCEQRDAYTCSLRARSSWPVVPVA